MEAFQPAPRDSALRADKLNPEPSSEPKKDSQQQFLLQPQALTCTKTKALFVQTLVEVF